MSEQTIILYLIGNSGSGKYTIAKELEKSGFIVCDNHLINNSILSLLKIDGVKKIPDFAWENIRKIRKSIFDFLSIYKIGNYVLTNNLRENERDRKIYRQVKNLASKRGSIFVPVKILISIDENLKRITNPSRKEKLKSIKPEDASPKEPLIKIKHKNLLEIDVTKMSAFDAAKIIQNHLINCCD